MRKKQESADKRIMELVRTRPYRELASYDGALYLIGDGCYHDDHIIRVPDLAEIRPSDRIQGAGLISRINSARDFRLVRIPSRCGQYILPGRLGAKRGICWPRYDDDLGRPNAQIDKWFLDNLAAVETLVYYSESLMMYAFYRNYIVNWYAVACGIRLNHILDSAGSPLEKVGEVKLYG